MVKLQLLQIQYSDPYTKIIFDFLQELFCTKKPGDSITVKSTLEMLDYILDYTNKW